MPTISIQATDTLFFRDGRPFSMGEESFAQGIFPPPPSVVFGALRSAFISGKLDDRNLLQHLIKGSEQLKINFIGLKSQNIGQSSGSLWLVMPADLIVRDEGKKDKGFPLKLENSPSFSNSQPMPKVLFSKGWDGKAVEGVHLIFKKKFQKYLNGELSNYEVQPLSGFIEKEPKIGIGRNQDSHTADDGKLFRVQTNRPAKVNGNVVQKLQIIVGYEQLEVSKNGWMALGGERKVAHFAEEEFFPIPMPDINSNQFKIYLATPAIFEHGWKPENLLRKHGLNLLSAAIGRSMPIGGWDLEQREPKPMLQTAAAGSVYFVEAKNLEAAKAAATAIHNTSISDKINNTNYGNQGFGIAYVGKSNINL